MEAGLGKEKAKVSWSNLYVRIVGIPSLGFLAHESHIDHCLVDCNPNLTEHSMLQKSRKNLSHRSFFYMGE
jgi:hypothetical protein